MQPNIHLKLISPNTYKMILNPATIPAVGSCDDIVLQWPINPDCTGAAGIASMLKTLPQFTNATFLTNQ